MQARTADPIAASIGEVAAKVETARAKVNLALHVGGRRPDGYHALDSLIVFAEVADTLRAAPGAEGEVRIALDGPFGPALAETPGNLVLRAATALHAALPPREVQGYVLHLTKRLPIAAGIGGGSADAAAALRLLNRLWGAGFDTARLAEIGIRLGADIPACLLSRPLRAEGIGERVTPVAGIPALPMLLLNPGIAVPTEAVFRRYRAGGRPPLPALPARFGSILAFVQWLRPTRNDLVEPAVAEVPAIAAAQAALSADPECLFARMSGSGATVFGIFLSVEAAARAADRIHAARPDWWVAVTTAGGS